MDRFTRTLNNSVTNTHQHTSTRNCEVHRGIYIYKKKTCVHTFTPIWLVHSSPPAYLPTRSYFNTHNISVCGGGGVQKQKPRRENALRSESSSSSVLENCANTLNVCVCVCSIRIVYYIHETYEHGLHTAADKTSCCAHTRRVSCFLLRAQAAVQC